MKAYIRHPIGTLGHQTPLDAIRAAMCNDAPRRVSQSTPKETSPCPD